jgi:hypothetical protein
MKRLLLAAALLTSAVVTPAVADRDASTTRKQRNPIVTPRVGDSQTTFVVRYRVPRGLHRGAPTHTRNGDEEYVAHVVKRRGRGCGGIADEFPARQIARKRGQRVTFRVRAPASGWCGGRTRVQIRRNYYYLYTEEDCSSTELPDAGSTQCEDRDVEGYGHERVGGFRVRVRR